MATAVKTWVFLTTLEGFVEVGDVVGDNIFISGSGSPAASCMLFTGNTTAERARTGTGVTWENWGVPAGNVVTSVQVTSWRLDSGTSYVVSNGNVKIRVLNSSNTTVHSAGDLVDKSSMPNAWTTYTDGISRAVDASYQASTTAVKMEVQCLPIAWDDGVDGGYASFLDTIELTITYTAAGGGGRRAKSQHSFRVGAAARA